MENKVIIEAKDSLADLIANSQWTVKVLHSDRIW